MDLSISSILLQWYEQNQRCFPWRQPFSFQDSSLDFVNNGDFLYRVLLSEIMLQQTTTTTVLGYFSRFLEAFPTLHHLATASQDDVLHLWQGLGYYSRGRNLHKAAQHLAEKNYPQTPEEWLKIPGVGPYTANALCAIGQNFPTVALDAHGWRIFSRLGNFQGPSWRQEAQKKAQESLPHQHFWAYTQSLMDFGTLICKAKNPLCDNCPLKNQCLAHKKNTVNECPPKTPKILKPKRYTLGHFYENTSGYIFLYKNHKEALLRGLWTIPMEPWIDKPLNSWGNLPLCTHHFTHFHSHCFLQRSSFMGSNLKHPLEKNHPDLQDFCWISLEDYEEKRYIPPLSTFVKKIINQWVKIKTNPL